jgi:dUTP pyrophosphatase
LTTVFIKRSPLGQSLDIPLPAYMTAGAAGADVHAAIESPITLTVGERRLVPCGFSMELPHGYEAQVRPRSGLALKHGVTVLNAPGTIDSDYRGEVGVLLINLGDKAFTINPLDRIGQIVIARVAHIHFLERIILTDTKRGDGGFGSSGV